MISVGRNGVRKEGANPEGEHGKETAVLEEAPVLLLVAPAVVLQRRQHLSSSTSVGWVQRSDCFFLSLEPRLEICDSETE